VLERYKIARRLVKEQKQTHCESQLLIRQQPEEVKNAKGLARKADLVGRFGCDARSSQIEGWRRNLTNIIFTLLSAEKRTLAIGPYLFSRRPIDLWAKFIRVLSRIS